MYPSKPCQHCGRSFSWRKKWEHCWDHVKYCSDGCRKASGSRIAGLAEKAIIDLLQSNHSGKALNPDTAARHLEMDQTGCNWQHAVREVMHAARRLSRQNQIQIIRKGKPVDADHLHGVVRLRLK